MMEDFLLCFVPLFVAVDVVGVLPMFIGLTDGIEPHKINRIIYQSIMTAALVALAFIAIGTATLNLLGITMADFMVAGGILLFIISMSDLLTTEKTRRKVDPEILGAVPLGVPLIAGPAVLTTSVLLLNEYGFIQTATAITANIFIAGIVFRFAKFINRLLGNAGVRIVSKIASLLLAAIGVMIVRKGITFLISGNI
jgi:multiple antibiotic resistance protein